jgi:hypothetical protein
MLGDARVTAAEAAEAAERGASTAAEKSTGPAVNAYTPYTPAVLMTETGGHVGWPGGHGWQWIFDISMSFFNHCCDWETNSGKRIPDDWEDVSVSKTKNKVYGTSFPSHGSPPKTLHKRKAGLASILKRSFFVVLAGAGACSAFNYVRANHYGQVAKIMGWQVPGGDLSGGIFEGMDEGMGGAMDGDDGMNGGTRGRFDDDDEGDNDDVDDGMTRCMNRGMSRGTGGGDDEHKDNNDDDDGKKYEDDGEL